MSRAWCKHCVQASAEQLKGVLMLLHDAPMFQSSYIFHALHLLQISTQQMSATPVGNAVCRNGNDEVICFGQHKPRWQRCRQSLCGLHGPQGCASRNSSPSQQQACPPPSLVVQLAANFIQGNTAMAALGSVQAVFHTSQGLLAVSTNKGVCRTSGAIGIPASNCRFTLCTKQADAAPNRHICACGPP